MPPLKLTSNLSKKRSSAKALTLTLMPVSSSNCGIRDLIPSNTGCSFIKIVIVFPECAFQSKAFAMLNENSIDVEIKNNINFFIYFLLLKYKVNDNTK